MCWADLVGVTFSLVLGTHIEFKIETAWHGKAGKIQGGFECEISARSRSGRPCKG